jgi:hypothetical protein
MFSFSIRQILANAPQGIVSPPCRNLIPHPAHNGTYGRPGFVALVVGAGLGVWVVLLLGADGAAEDVEAFWDGLVVDPSASFLAGDEACVAEYFQVVADGGL